MKSKTAKTSSKPKAKLSDVDDIARYNKAHTAGHAEICNALRTHIDGALPKAIGQIWHGSPVWFVGENPVVGYSVTAKKGVGVLFWNGQSFNDETLKPVGKFKAAQILYTDESQIDPKSLRRWLKLAGTDVWDYRGYFLAQKALQAKAKK